MEVMTKMHWIILVPPQKTVDIALGTAVDGLSGTDTFQNVEAFLAVAMMMSFWKKRRRNCFD